MALLALAGVAVVLVAYFLFTNSQDSRYGIVSVGPVNNDLSSNQALPDTGPAIEKKGNIQQDSRYLQAQEISEKKIVSKANTINASTPEKAKNNRFASNERPKSKSKGPFYQVRTVAHFYNKPSEKARRKDFIEYWNVSNGVIKPVSEKKDFIYVVYQQPLGPTTEGWLRKKDLKKVNAGYENNKD